MRRPSQDEFATFYKGYIDLVSGNQIIDSLTLGLKRVDPILRNLSSEQWDHRYEPEKWSIKETWLHVIDTERIMAYRALRMARGDSTPIPGFDQDSYVPLSGAESRSGNDILEEYHAVRAASIALFLHMNEDVLDRRGIASGYSFSVRALGFIIAGHELHHLQILQERYL